MGEALGGADGASAAGTNEMLMPLLVDLAGNSPERLRALSRIVGGASSGNAQGAWIAEQGTTWNRQLHQNEVIAIRDQAKAYAEKQGISESEALSALLLEGMRQVDEDYAGNILANPEAASFLQQIAQSDPDNALVSTDGKVTGYFEASDHDYEKFDAYKWQLWNVENGWYPGGVEDPNLLSQTFTDPQNILMLGEGKAYYDFRDLYQQVSGESASKAGNQRWAILGGGLAAPAAISAGVGAAGWAATQGQLLSVAGLRGAQGLGANGYANLWAAEGVASLGAYRTGTAVAGAVAPLQFSGGIAANAGLRVSQGVGAYGYASLNSVTTGANTGLGVLAGELILAERGYRVSKAVQAYIVFGNIVGVVDGAFGILPGPKGFVPNGLPPTPYMLPITAGQEAGAVLKDSFLFYESRVGL